MKPVRNLCNIFHLYHEETYSQENQKKSMLIFNNVIKTKELKCKNGIVRI
jgi:hypothetical protein